MVNMSGHIPKCPFGKGISGWMVFIVLCSFRMVDRDFIDLFVYTVHCKQTCGFQKFVGEESTGNVSR